MKGASVLLVEDDEDGAEVVSRFLELKGHRVVGARSAEDAADRLRAGRFDFVLLDVVLPGVTGLQALAALTKLTRAPIHMMSGQHEQDVLPDASLLGAKGFFQKPLDLDALSAALDALPPAA